MNHAIVTAAGKSARFGGDKQLYSILGQPMLIRSLRPFEEDPDIAQIIVTYPPDKQEVVYRRICDECGFTKVRLIRGGETRYHSVRKAFESIEQDRNDDVVLIHDAARPLLRSALLRRVLEATIRKGCAVPVVPVRETVKEIEGQKVLRTVPRERLFLAQTPQGFLCSILADSYNRVKTTLVTDESTLVEMAGYEVHVVTGDPVNIKVTEFQDIAVAESYLREAQ